MVRCSKVVANLAAVAVLIVVGGCGSQLSAAPAANGNAPVATGEFKGACTAPSDANNAPQSLLDTGCFAASGKAATSLYAYEVNGTLWSDGASKERWLLLPQASPASFDGNGVMQLPPGGAVVKQFNRNGARLETRFLFPDRKGVMQALTYAWNDAGTDATLIAADGAMRNFADGSTWEYFSRDNCMYCHNSVGGPLLGPRLPQLNRDVVGSANQTVNQLADMVAHNVVKPGFDGNVTPWPAPDSTAPLPARARTYLATNCSFCHSPGGYSGTQVDLRYDTPLNQTGACNEAPNFGDFGMADAKLIAPGNPNNSILSFRVHSSTIGQKMPPVGHAVTDPAGSALLDAWIASLSGCEGP